MAFLTREQIEEMGFKSVGENVRLSDKASFYNCGNISIGSNVRIDDFCLFCAGTGGIELGSFIHISPHCTFIGDGKITLKDFTGTAARVSIYSSSDDYTGAALGGPMVPDEYRSVNAADVTLNNYVMIGSGSVVLPGVVFEEGVGVGALSLVTKSCKEYSFYMGNPARRIKALKQDVSDLAKQFLATFNKSA